VGVWPRHHRPRPRPLLQVLGPRPGDQLLSQLHEAPGPDHVLRNPLRCAQWAADLGALLDDVLLSRCDGAPHEAAETVQAVLIELQVREGR
jgi:hypothetical protein